MSVEEWRPIPGYEGRYDVSDQGRVRSWRPGTRSSTVPYILKASMGQSNGYPTVGLHGGAKQRMRRVHRLVTEAFIGPLPDDSVTRHLNGDKGDNRLSNLQYGTASENELDKVEHGANVNATKTSCPQGHPYSESNTRICRAKGRIFRLCKTCEADGQRARRARRRSAA